MLQPSEVTTPASEKIGFSPVFIMTDEPVPKVALIMPGVRQPCPNSAPWLSPSTPWIGMGASK